jgi:flagellar hook assembly protein FlgD
LINVLDPRPVRVRFFDLSGRLLLEEERDGTAGQQVFRWGGRDEQGQLVPPGLYIVELNVGGDAGDESQRRLVPVAY